MSSVVTRWAAVSSTGLVRAANEDSGYAGRWLQAVADGMGGHAAGDVASATVIRALARHDEPSPAGTLAGTLRAAVIDANTAIRQRTQADPALRTMGTTLTAMLWAGDTYALAHIGDSRAYLLRDGQLRQLTEDHALANLVANAGAVPFLAPVMTRFLDGRPDRSPDISVRQARPGDRYLLCSDGLTAVVPDQAIHDALKPGASLQETAGQLVTLTDAGGAPDNITVILIDVAATQTGHSHGPAWLGAAAPAED
jgi:PPM family protein phosphatase